MLKLAGPGESAVTEGLWREPLVGFPSREGRA